MDVFAPMSNGRRRLAGSLTLLLAGALGGCVSETVVYCADPTCGGDDAGVPIADGAQSGGPHDLAVPRGSHDMARKSPDMAIVPPPFGTVGPQGGSVNRLLFGVTGDTRPINCDDVAGYPTQVLTSIFAGMQGAGVQFAIATGDHQFVCAGGYANSVQQLQLYQQAMKGLAGKVVFPTMGNHECSETSFCSTTGYTPGRFKAYIDLLLKPYGLTQPYFSFDVTTDAGVARFVFAADTAWDAAQSAWLSQTLASAQNTAKYLFIMRHYPLGTRFGDNSVDPSLNEEENIINQYHYTLLLNGHTHQYKHDSARTVTMGLGGAPLTGRATYYGYMVVEQLAGGDIDVRLYDEASGNVMDQFSVTP